jgi:hypothetical protein
LNFGSFHICFSFRSSDYPGSWDFGSPHIGTGVSQNSTAPQSERANLRELYFDNNFDAGETANLRELRELYFDADYPQMNSINNMNTNSINTNSVNTDSVNTNSISTNSVNTIDKNIANGNVEASDRYYAENARRMSGIVGPEVGIEE